MRVTNKSPVLLVELLMMKHRLERTDGCCCIRRRHRAETSFWETHVSSNLQSWEKMNASARVSPTRLRACARYLLVSSRVGGSASPRRSSSTALCAHGAALMTLNRHQRVTSVKENARNTYHSSSFWLRVRQVSGKQAMFPRIPTQIS